METIDIKSLAIAAGERVLDLGCGEGRHAIALAYYFPKAQVFGLDLCHQDLHTAQKKHREFSQLSGSAAQSEAPQTGRTVYLQGNAYKLPFADNSFDHLVCSEVLEHLEHYTLAIAEMQRIVKPGGSLSVSVPRAWPEKICWWLSREYHSVEGGHVRIFNERALRQEIEHSKFNYLRKHFAHALHAPYWWLRCLVWREDNSFFMARWYHKLLVWDLLKKPALTRTAEKWLNPILGKSVVLYFTKHSNNHRIREKTQ